MTSASFVGIVFRADLHNCRVIHDILATVLLVGNFLNTVSTRGRLTFDAVQLY